jgi:hypothetical protein
MVNSLVLAIKVSKITAEPYTNVDSFIVHLEELLKNYEVSVFLATYSHDD